MNMRPASGPLLLTAGITFLAACIGVTLSLFAGLFPGVMQELLISSRHRRVVVHLLVLQGERRLELRSLGRRSGRLVRCIDHVRARGRAAHVAAPLLVRVALASN